MADHEPATAASTPPDPAALLERIERLEGLVAALTQERENRVLPQNPGASRLVMRSAVVAEAATPVSTPAASSLPRLRTQSLESQFGTRVLSKVAVVLLLIGAAWFLKWAFDNRWIGPAGRVIAGLVAGASVVVWSERFRRQSLTGFSYALKAVGSGVLYLSLWAAFQVYHLIPATVALVAMMAVTATIAFLAYSQDTELLAGFALLGGYLTPVLLSTGGDHEVFLFTYLFIFAVAVFALLIAKPWPRLLLGAFPATAIYFIAWYSQHFATGDGGLTLFFVFLLWLPFAAVPLVACEPDVPIAGVLTPLAAASFVALAVYSVLVDTGRAALEPWAAVLLAAIYLGLTRVRRTRVASAVHLSLAVVFLTIAIPLKATGRAITAGWLAEAVALLWVAGLPRVDSRARQALRWLACGSLLLGVIGAVIAPWWNGAALQPFFNRNFGVAMGAVLALSVAISLCAGPVEPVESSAINRNIAMVSFIALNLVLLTAMYRELSLYFHTGVAPSAYGAATEQSDFAFSGWMMLQGVALMVAGFWRRVTLPRWLGLTLLVATVLKAFAYDMRNMGTGYRVISYLGLGVILMAVSFAYQKDWLSVKETDDLTRHSQDVTR
jgi:uncharacterized membrane protein